MVQLMEVFVDFPVKIRSWGGDKSHRTKRTVKPKNYPHKGLIRAIKRHIKDLQERYPDKGYEARDMTLKGERMLRIRRADKGLRRVPIYFEVRTGRFFVPKTYVKRKYRLTCSVINYRLHALGVC